MKIKQLKTTEKTSDKKLELIGRDYQAEILISPLNKRIILKNYQGEVSTLLQRLKMLAQAKDLTKIWAKASIGEVMEFKAAGFIEEATITAFYSGKDAVSLAYFLEDRKQRDNVAKQEEILADLEQVSVKSRANLAKDYSFKLAEKSDIATLAQLYDQVFTSYPYPINDEFYLKEMMEKKVIYGLIYKEDNLVAAASAELNQKHRNAEMTDFATLPEVRGKGLAFYLLNSLEEKLAEKDYKALYTIARAKIYGINKIFCQSGYQYTGKLINNCEIAGGLEDMNLWSKVIN